jgi:tRNA threonylcarbamoyladenosine biosynthesis protein TsaE
MIEATDRQGEKPREMFTVISKSPQMTHNLAAALGALLGAGETALLMGDLGAGKTTFAQGLCRGAGMAADQFVRSPTFTLINEYQGRAPIRHADLYRLDTVGDLATIGLFDPAFSGITIIEWADKLPEGMDLQAAWSISIKEISETDREITFFAPKMRESEISRIITKGYGSLG